MSTSSSSAQPKSPRSRHGSERRSLTRQSSLPLHYPHSNTTDWTLLRKLKRSRIKWIFSSLGAIGLVIYIVRHRSYTSRKGSRVIDLNPIELEIPIFNPPVQPSRPSHLPEIPSPHTLSHTPFDVAVRTKEPIRAIRPNEKFLSYSPHSGYHNQRISLENALTLAFILKRTLLLPPIWLGQAIPYISFFKLQRRLQMASKVGLEGCLEPFAVTSRECEGFWDWTMVDWNFLINFEAIEGVEVRPRWNLSSEWLIEELGLEKKADLFELEDDTMYQFRFYDSALDEEPLGKYTKRIDIEQLAEDSSEAKLLSLGTLFGTSRIRASKEENGNARIGFRTAAIFKNTLLDSITERIRDKLGGSGMYYSLHLRVGDGEFQKSAKKTTRDVWNKLCLEKMKLGEELCQNIGKGDFSKYEMEPPLDSKNQLAKRANSQPQKGGAFHHSPLPKLKLFNSRKDSPLSPSLTCRRRLYTHSELLPFNIPLYIATDSKIPTTDQNLAIFFRAFPCTFVLSDFASVSSYDAEAVEGFEQLVGMRNEEDLVPLAQFLYPILDAQVAAYGRGLIGTPNSTFSRFAIDVLHQVYHGWDVISRG